MAAISSSQGQICEERLFAAAGNGHFGEKCSEATFCNLTKAKSWTKSPSYRIAVLEHICSLP